MHVQIHISMKRKSFLSLGTGILAASSFKSANAKILDAQFNDVVSMSNSGYQEFDWKTLRTLFPLNNDRIFLNNGTMGITPYPVLKAVQNSFEKIAETAEYPHHSDNLEKILGEIIGADAKEIGITKNVSEGINHICWGLDLKRGDEVILTEHEHVGGCLAWLHRAKIDGIVIKTFPLGKTADETLNNLNAAITKKTRAIAVPHIPCTIGQILPVKEICDLARTKNIISCIDGAHPLGMIQFNVKDIGCDYYAGCFHKWALGPIGTGWLYISQQRIQETKIFHVAAYSANEFNMRGNPPSMGPILDQASRYSYGTFCGPLHIGATKALEFYQKIGPSRIEARVKFLAEKLQNSLLEFGDKIEMLTPTEEKSRGAQIGFRIKQSKKDNPNIGFVNHARSNQIILRHVAENGLDNIRISTHYYNSEEEIEQCVSLLKTYAFG